MQPRTIAIACALTLLLALSAGGLATPQQPPESNSLAAQVEELQLEVDELQDFALDANANIGSARELTNSIDKKLNDTNNAIIDKIRAIEVDDDEDDGVIGELVGRVDVLQAALGGPDTTTARQGHFLAIADIAGESTDPDHADEIEIVSWSWGATQTTGTGSGSGASAGKVNVSDISITKTIDKSSPILFMKCAQGQHIPEVVLTTKSDNRTDYLVITLTDVLVSSYQTSGGAHEMAEQVSFHFAKIKVEYVPAGAGSPVVATWDVVNNAP